MVYDAGGQRVVRQEANKTTLYLDGAELTVTGSGTLLQGGSTTVSQVRYYSHAGQTIAARTGSSNDTVVTLIPDWQGTTHQQVANATGSLSTSWQDPYGARRGAAPAGWVGERGFVGGTNDATGLVRVGARDYDVLLGRFVTVDPVQDLADPLQWNPYVYANNSPITKSDPSGLRPIGDGDGEFVPRWRHGHTEWDCKGGRSKGSGGHGSSGSGKQAGDSPAGSGAAPVPDPQVQFWQNVGHVGVAVLATAAIVAICAGTAGIGCLVMAGIAVGVAAGVADYAIDTVPEGRFDAGEAVMAGATGGVLGGASAGVGAGIGMAVSKGITAVAARLATKTLGGGGGEAVANTAQVVPSQAGDGSPSGPTFIGFESGPPAIVPQGAVGPTLTRGPGVQYTGGSGGLGMHPNTSGVRIMDQTAHHGARVVYMNQAGQTINPFTGRTVPKSDPWAHLPW